MRVLILAGILVSGCAHTQSPEPKIVIREVKIPVPVSCITDEVPSPPAGYADDGVEDVQDPVERQRMRGAANLQRKGRLAIVEPAIAACRKTPGDTK